MRGDEINLEGDAIDFDVVTELAFADRSAYLSWRETLGSGNGGERVSADERMFLDQSRTRAYVIEEHVTST